MAMDSYTGYSDLEGETGSHDEQLSSSSSGSEASDVELPSRVRDKTNYSTDQVLDDLFRFDTGGIRKKRYRTPSDSVDKGQPSKQSRSSLPSNFGHEKRSKKTATPKTPSRTPQPIRRNPLGNKTNPKPTQDFQASAHKTGGKESRKQPPNIGNSSDEQVDNEQSLTFQDQGIASALGELTNTLKKVVKQLEKQESRLDSVEKKLSSPAVSSSSSSGDRKKPKISLVVKAEVRRIYRTLLEQDENFTGFDTEKGSSFKDSVNSRIVERLIKEVKSANPAFAAGEIRSASYGHYRSICQEESLKRRGKHTERNAVRRRKERLNRKLTNRLAALERSTVNDHQKSKYLAVLVPEFMSSEESGEDSENEDTYTVRAIPWRSSRVDNLFDQLDGEVLQSMSKQSKRQLKKRILSEEHSDRPIPSGKFPSWAFAEAQ